MQFPCAHHNDLYKTLTIFFHPSTQHNNKTGIHGIQDPPSPLPHATHTCLKQSFTNLLTSMYILTVAMLWAYWEPLNQISYISHSSEGDWYSCFTFLKCLSRKIISNQSINSVSWEEKINCFWCLASVSPGKYNLSPLGKSKKYLRVCQKLQLCMILEQTEIHLLMIIWAMLTSQNSIPAKLCALLWQTYKLLNYVYQHLFCSITLVPNLFYVKEHL